MNRDITKTKEDFLSHVYMRVVPSKYKEAREAAGALCFDVEDIGFCYCVDTVTPKGEKLIATLKTGFLDCIKDHMGITEEELRERAIRNSAEFDPATISTMSEMIAKISGIDSELSECDEHMWVVSTESMRFGASAIIYPGLLDEIAVKLGGNYYIIPSSIHEVIVVRESEGIELEVLNGLVKEVNAKEVEENEVLANSVYRYRKSVGKLEKVS